MTNYQIDVPIDEYPYEIKESMVIEKEFINTNGERETIKCVKDGGIMNYPPYLKMVRHSKGLIKPKVS